MMGAFCDITKGNHVSLADITITGAKPSFNSPVCTTFAPVVIRMYNISLFIFSLLNQGLHVHIMTFMTSRCTLVTIRKGILHKT